MSVIGHSGRSATEAEGSVGSCLESLNVAFFSGTWFGPIKYFAVTASLLQFATWPLMYHIAITGQKERMLSSFRWPPQTCSIGNLCRHQIGPVAFLLKYSPWCHEKQTAQFYGSCRSVVGSLIEPLVGSRIVPQLRQIYFEPCFICHKSGMGIAKAVSVMCVSATSQTTCWVENLTLTQWWSPCCRTLSFSQKFTQKLQLFSIRLLEYAP